MADDLGSLARDLRAATGHVLDRLELVERKASLDIVATAQQLVPVDTGHLKGSIGTDEPVRDASSVEVEMGPTADYGGYVEHGTARHGPQPYMSPSADRHEEPFVEACRQIGAQAL